MSLAVCFGCAHDLGKTITAVKLKKATFDLVLLVHNSSPMLRCDAYRTSAMYPSSQKSMPRALIQRVMVTRADGGAWTLPSVLIGGRCERAGPESHPPALDRPLRAPHASSRRAVG